MKITQSIIQYVGLNDLSSSEKRLVEKIAAEYQEKIQHMVDKPMILKIHFKIYNEEGNKKKYSVTAEAQAAEKIQFTTKRADWDLARAMHRAFKYLEREIEKHLHPGDKGSGKRRPRARVRPE